MATEGINAYNPFGRTKPSYGLLLSWTEIAKIRQKRVEEADSLNLGQGHFAVARQTAEDESGGFLAAGAGQRSSIFQYFDESMRGDKEFVLDVVKKDGMALEFVTNNLKADRDVVLAAVRQNGYALQFAAESLKADKGIILEAVKQNGYALQYATEKPRSNKIFQKQLFETNFSSFEYMINPALEICAEYEQMAKDLTELNISNYERFNTASAREIIKNRKGLNDPDERPTAVIVFSKEDDGTPGRYPGVLSQNQIAELIAKKYKVLYFEVGKDEEFYQAVQDSGKTKKISLLVIGGHGGRTYTSFGAAGDGNSISLTQLLDEENKFLDIGDTGEMSSLSLGQYLEEGATIVLQSCATGEGGSEESNVANTLKKIFPNCYIFAPMGVSYINGFIYDENNRVVDIMLVDRDKAGLYKITPTPQKE